MQKTVQIVFVAIALALASCGAKNENRTLTEKKVKLEQLKKDQTKISDSISTLEKEIAKLDTGALKTETAKLVGISTLATQNFTHYIDLQGKVDAENISYISPRMGPGQVKALYVKKGDYVKKGQLLVQLEDAVMRQNIVAAKQSLETLKTQSDYAKNIYNRTKNLWDQGIGTEIQLITAKNNVDGLDKQLKAGDENIKTLQEQLKTTMIYSDVDGVADEVNVRTGELFTGFSGTSPQIKIVNTSNLKVVTEVPENYSGKVRQGSSVVINIPDLNKTLTGIVSVAGKVINPNSRAFTIEVKIPSDGVIRPNQIAQVKIQDYEAKNTIAIPVNTVQSDEKSKYVYVAEKQGDKLIAKKKAITIGELYGELVEVKSGLTAGEQLITQGFQNIYDGQVLKTELK